MRGLGEMKVPDIHYLPFYFLNDVLSCFCFISGYCTERNIFDVGAGMSVDLSLNILMYLLWKYLLPASFLQRAEDR